MEEFHVDGLRVFADYDEATAQYTVRRVLGDRSDRALRALLGEMSPPGYPPVKWPKNLLQHTDWPSDVLTAI